MIVIGFMQFIFSVTRYFRVKDFVDMELVHYFMITISVLVDQLLIPFFMEDFTNINIAKQ